MVLVGDEGDQGEDALAKLDGQARHQKEPAAPLDCNDTAEISKTPARVEHPIPEELPVTKEASVAMDTQVAINIHGEQDPLSTQELSPAEVDGRSELDDIDDEDFDEEDISSHNMLEFVKL
ncbi:hypothetical protein ElyMa_003137000 [Elysia marginata]|uniref:Uncharacterized protein n=1 Tax=Elysia marginata TaxID=1093978 RepID=A0AAV4IW23_9GAST|nr:hypothetical protein ElyMa_003137000 [Elysia marginata]